MSEIYLDHAATTPMKTEVIEEVVRIMNDIYGNPSSVHALGRKAKIELMKARKVVANSLGAKENEIIFTSGGTEGDNTAIIETAFKQQHLGKHIITTQVEHPAVLEPMKYLEAQGFEVTYLPVDDKGMIHLEDVKQVLRTDTILVSIMTANNETGNIFPIAEIGELLKDHQAIFHTDAVQAYGILPLNVKALQVDLLSVSAHKFNGPKGVGFLYKKDTISLPAYLKGGEQEDKHRAGTENLANIVGMAKAIELLTTEEKEKNYKKMAELTETILTTLTENKISYHLNGDEKNKLPHVLNLQFKGVHKDILLMKLDLQGIAVSSGSACTAGSVDPSHVLEAMYGKNHPAIQESLRISLGYENTLSEIQQFLNVLIPLLKTAQSN